MIRQQILDAASIRLKRLGFDKTKVAELAADIGFSKAYIYKFYISKQAIADNVCARHLQEILDIADEGLATAGTAAEQIRRLFSILVAESIRSFFEDRKLYDICATSALEQWPSTIDYTNGIDARLKSILQSGRQRGEFERKTPIDEVQDAVSAAMISLINPLMLQYRLDQAPLDVSKMTALVLRSLAP